MSTTGRSRKIDFIEASFSCEEDEKILIRLFREKGLDWLADNQLEDMISEWVDANKLRSRMNRQNRQLAASAKHGRAA
jgi:hypothetical protein